MQEKIRIAILNVATFFERHLTPVSIGVALFGIAMVILGPVLGVLPGRPVEDEQTYATMHSAEGVTLVMGGSEGAGGPVALSRALQPYTTIPDRPRNTVITYVVQPGDTVSGIAERFGISPDTIFWANDVLRDNVHLLGVGVEIYILPTDGVYHRSDGQYTISWIAQHYQVTPEAIIESEFNQLDGYTSDDIPPEGMRIVVPGGVRDYRVADFPWFQPDNAPGAGSSAGTGYRFAPGHPGSCAATAGYGGTGAWIRPVQGGYTITTGYYPYHPAIDLAGVLGTPIVAADSGVVIFAGWNDWGYGNLVVLDHGNGWMTFYAHLSSVGVGCGQFVSRGAYIGAMGSTGQSTGPHLHFEMRWGTVPDNPFNHLSF